jgi:Holliday junction resolvase
MPGYSKAEQLANGRNRNKIDMIKKDPKHNRQRSKAQERSVEGEYKAVGYKAHRVPGSGAFHEALLFADVDVENLLLVEAKETRTGKITIDPEWVEKVKAEAAALGKRFWAIHTWVAEEEANYKKLVIVEQDTWMTLLKERKELEKENEHLLEDLAGEDI